MKTLILFALIAGMMGFAKKPEPKPTSGGNPTFTGNPRWEYICDLAIDTVCFDHTDGKGHKKEFTKDDQVKVLAAIERKRGKNDVLVCNDPLGCKLPEGLNVAQTWTGQQAEPKDGDIRCATYIGSWVEIPCTDLFTPRPAKHDWACGSKRDGTASECPDWLKFPKESGGLKP